MKIDITHITKLANFSLDTNEKKRLEKQLGEILKYINKLEEVDTHRIEPTSQVTGLESVTREDKITPSFTQDEVLSNTKSTQNGMFKVKAILK